MLWLPRHDELSMNRTDSAGYYLGPNDDVAFVVELMNESEDTRSAVVTIIYEYVPGVPDGWAKVTPVWLDIGSCDDSELPAKNDTFFEYSSTQWKSTVKGNITWIAGHLHDGGTHLEVLKNNQTVCDCRTAYGQTPGYVEKMSNGMNMPGMDMVHISSISTCANAGSVSVGDEWSVNAFYNTSEYSPMMESDNALAPIMGISLLYIAHNGSTVAASNVSTSSSSTSSAAAATSSAAGTAAMTPVSGVFAGLIAAIFI
jgi:hypothetical protein